MTVPSALEASVKATTLGALASEGLDVAGVERAVRPDRRLAHHEPVVLGHLDPRRDVGVVVELGDDDLVARRRVRATAWASRKLSVVMFGPKAISSGALPVRAAAAPRAAATSAAVSPGGGERTAVVGGPACQVRAHASITTSGTCDPPGLSR